MQLHEWQECGHAGIDMSLVMLLLHEIASLRILLHSGSDNSSGDAEINAQFNSVTFDVWILGKLQAVTIRQAHMQHLEGVT